MSRLESMRRRLTAQIDGLNWATTQIAGLKGDVLESGLGNGRTYDHLRQEMPDRRIWVIDRVLNPHPSCLPPSQDFLQGEAGEMLGHLAHRRVQVALAHYDFGFGVNELDLAEGAKLSPLITAIVAKGGLIVSQQPMIGVEQIRGPDTIDPERYLFYRV